MNRTTRARAGAYKLHSQYDATYLTTNAREKFMLRFEREVDPDGVLDADERAKRAAYARKAYFTSLALKSARARQAKRKA